MKKLGIIMLCALLCACSIEGGGLELSVDTGEKAPEIEPIEETTAAEETATVEDAPRAEEAEKEAAEEAIAQESAPEEAAAEEFAPEEVQTQQASAEEQESAPLAPGGYADLSGEANGWGFRRMLPDRPEFTSGQVSMMTKYNCLYMGSADEKVLYLTFDEGYENGYTPQILDTLAEKGVKAAFFITGSYFNHNADLVARMINEGHIVGNHTYSHPNLAKISVAEAEEDILKLDRMFYEKFGTHMSYLRPPEGAYSERSLALTRDLGYRTVLWSLAYRDWDTNDQKGTDYAYEQVTKNLHNGSVMLLHAVSVDNTNALGSIIDYASEQGYTFKTLDEYK